MMYIHIAFSKKNHSTHSTELLKIFFSLLTFFTAFLQEACGPGKKLYNVHTLYTLRKRRAIIKLLAL